MFKKSKGFLVGVLFTILAMAGAAQLGWVKIDITITEKGAAVIQSGKAALNSAQNEAAGLLSGGSKSDGQ
jgi:hypothetical protein